MKINPLRIIFDHFGTLSNATTGRRSIFDFFLFYFLPFALSITAIDSLILSTKDFFSVSITFFGIFIALLLNIQVAMFGIYQRRWRRPQDSAEFEEQTEAIRTRGKLLGEINSNISYCILFSTFSLFLFLVFYAVGEKTKLPTSISIFIYVHFLLTLMMIVKRAHALFEREYRCEPTND